MSKQTEAQRLAEVLPQFGGATCHQAAAELLRQEALIAELAGALGDMLSVHGVRWEHVRGDSSIPASWVELSDKARAALAKVQQ